MPERISGLRAKRIQRQPNVLKILPLHTFPMPVVISPFVRWFYNDSRVTTNTGYHRNVWSLSFFLHFPVYNFFHVRLRAGKRCGVNRFTEAKVNPCSSRRCKLRPFGFCRKSPRLCFALVVFFEKKLTSTKHFPSYSLGNTVTSTGSDTGQSYWSPARKRQGTLVAAG